MNKALPIEKLRGVVFAEPISSQYGSLCSLIGQYTAQNVDKTEIYSIIHTCPVAGDYFTKSTFDDLITPKVFLQT